MTATDDFLVDHDRPDSRFAPSVRGLAARRWFVVLAPVLGGLFCLVGAVADPAAGLSGERMFQLYAENPGPLQWKSLGYHWGYAFWIGAALLVVPWVRSRGVWLANVGALLGFAGATTLPGLLAVDWYHSAVGREYGVDAVLGLEQSMADTMWGLPVFMLLGILGLALALPVAAAGLWRAGVVRWWAFAAVVGAFAVFTVSQATWWGTVGTTLLLGVFSVALARGTAPTPTP